MIQLANYETTAVSQQSKARAIDSNIGIHCYADGPSAVQGAHPAACRHQPISPIIR